MKYFSKLPVEIQMKILSYLSFEELSKTREVCSEFNVLCGSLLTSGFNKIESRNLIFMKKVKSQLPKRESERRAHNLATHMDVLSSLDTRLSILRMTYRHFIESNTTCFIPGKVLDELSRIHRVVFKNNEPVKFSERPAELLHELRDLSSMAVEHFEENIASSYKVAKKSTFGSSFDKFTEKLHSFFESPLLSTPASSSKSFSNPRSSELAKKFSFVQKNKATISSPIISLTMRNQMHTSLNRHVARIRHKNFQTRRFMISQLKLQNQQIAAQNVLIADMQRELSVYKNRIDQLLSTQNKKSKIKESNEASPAKRLKRQK